MARRLVIGTRNRGKVAEIAAILGDLDLVLVPLSEVGTRSGAECGPVPTVEETGETFEANARAKALGYARATGEWVLADDSGLEVDALGGRPGVLSSRWGGEQGNDRLNNQALLRALAGRPKETWTARFRCAAALATPERVLAVTEGACEGRITDRPAGASGFGYDPHFVVDGHGRTMAELGPEVKNRLSHRARALVAMKARLEKLL
jgi:XTP/dITP diphosphohydrolase